MNITKRPKLKPIDSIKIECGFGCLITIKTVEKFTNEEKLQLAWPTIDTHNLIFHGLEVDKKIYLDEGVHAKES